MFIRTLETTPFSIPFRRQFRLTENQEAVREGVVLALHGDLGGVGIGEAAPHPAAGPEALGAAVEEARTWKDTVVRNRVAAADLLEGVRALPATPVRVALEMACCDLLGQHQNVSVASLLGPVRRTHVPVNALIGILDAERSVIEARRFVREGYSTIKVKLDGQRFGDELKRLTAIRAAVGTAIALRVDVNAVWTVEQAVPALRHMAACGIEYVEQPVASIEEMARLRPTSAIRLAADECVRSEADVEAVVRTGAADVVIVKPSLVGLVRAARILGATIDAGLTPVVTSNLDTSIGIAAAFHLAATLRVLPICCGLGTAGLLEGDLVTAPLVPRNAALDLPAASGLGLRLDRAALERFRRAPQAAFRPR